MAEDLIEFWQRYSPASPPFIHPDDRESLHRILRRKDRIVEDDPTSFDSYINHRRFGNPNDDLLHLSLLPVPYSGDLRNAEIVVLLLNPGFNHCDYWAEYNVPNFREQLKRNLCQSFDGVEYPFSGLDPQFCWYSGFMWWEKKLREVVVQIAEKQGSSYLDALRSLSKRLACLELIPYHSASFQDHGLIPELPSIAKAKSFVTDVLVPDAIVGKRTLIVTRGAKTWELKIDRKRSNIIVYEGGHTRGASLGTKSSGGKAILARYGIG